MASLFQIEAKETTLILYLCNILLVVYINMHVENYVLKIYVSASSFSYEKRQLSNLSTILFSNLTV